MGKDYVLMETISREYLDFPEWDYCCIQDLDITNLKDLVEVLDKSPEEQFEIFGGQIKKYLSSAKKQAFSDALSTMREHRRQERSEPRMLTPKPPEEPFSRRSRYNIGYRLPPPTRGPGLSSNREVCRRISLGYDGEDRPDMRTPRYGWEEEEEINLSGTYLENKKEINGILGGDTKLLKKYIDRDRKRFEKLLDLVSKYQEASHNYEDIVDISEKRHDFREAKQIAKSEEKNLKNLKVSFESKYQDCVSDPETLKQIDEMLGTANLTDIEREFLVGLQADAIAYKNRNLS